MKNKSTKPRSSQKRSKAARAAETARLREQPDTEIDYSDIPETDATFWAKAQIVRPEPGT